MSCENGAGVGVAALLEVRRMMYPRIDNACHKWGMVVLWLLRCDTYQNRINSCVLYSTRLKLLF